MDNQTASSNIIPEQPSGKKPSKEVYDRAFDEWAILLFKQYRKKKRAEITESLDDMEIDNK